MISLNESTSLWHMAKGRTCSGHQPQEPGDPVNPINLEGPICCWNFCPSIGGAKTPRPPRLPHASALAFSLKKAGEELSASDGITGSANLSPAVPLPAQRFTASTIPVEIGPQSLQPFQHVTRRLLKETLGPDRHLVFNPLSGALDLFTEREWNSLERLQHGGTKVLSTAQEQALRKRGYLFDTKAQEEECLEEAVSQAWTRMQHSQPESYTVCPTLACNLACAYCFEGDSLLDKPQGVMTDAQVEAVFDAIAEIQLSAAAQGQASAHAPWISLFGGEPLLPSTKRCVAHILRLAAERGFLVGATTNGVNVTRFAALLEEYQDILATFQITLDGPQAVHDSRRHRLGGQGTFAEIVQGIDLLLSLDIDVDVRVNLDAANLAALPELVDFVFEKGWPSQAGFQLALAPVTQHGPEDGSKGCASKSAVVLSEMELIQSVLGLMDFHPRLAQICHLGFLRHLSYLVGELEPERGKPRRQGAAGEGARRAGPRYWYCEASSDRQFVFTPEGLIYRCTEAVGKPHHAIGRFDPALDIWQEESRQWTGRTILSHPQCRDCAISTLCGGGCHFAARERPAGQTAHEAILLQIALPRTLSKAYPHAEAAVADPDGARGGFQKPRARTIHAADGRRTEPFCNAAEETVRGYLRHIGCQLTA